MEQMTYLFLSFNAFSCLSMVSVFILIISSFSAYNEEAQREDISSFQPCSKQTATELEPVFSYLRGSLGSLGHDGWITYFLNNKLYVTWSKNNESTDSSKLTIKCMEYSSQNGSGLQRAYALRALSSFQGRCASSTHRAMGFILSVTVAFRMRSWALQP